MMEPDENLTMSMLEKHLMSAVQRIVELEKEISTLKKEKQQKEMEQTNTYAARLKGGGKQSVQQIQLVSEMINESELRNKRCKNVVISGVPESKKENHEERTIDDTAAVEVILNDCNMKIRAKGVFRLR